MAAGRENRIHIGIFGRCNAGKSTLLNFITDSAAAIVSESVGTTTDPVRKSFEIAEYAPVLFIDTAGIDDGGSLGGLRLQKSLDAIHEVDLALLVYTRWGDAEEALATQFRSQALPYIAICNDFGNDTLCDTSCDTSCDASCDGIGSDARSDLKINLLHADNSDRIRIIDQIKRVLGNDPLQTPSMFNGLVDSGDLVILVCPIDSSAPQGRLILPQVQALRDLLDRHCVAITVQPQELRAALSIGLSPRLIVTDSQLFREVRQIAPENIEVTSFSILLAAAKGDYNRYQQALEQVDQLQNGDRILIIEHCSHQVSCDDIGRVKIPVWLEQYTGKKFQFSVISARMPLPNDLSDFALAVQCGGCMVTRRQLMNIVNRAASAGVSITNYGMLIKKIRA